MVLWTRGKQNHRKCSEKQNKRKETNSKTAKISPRLSFSFTRLFWLLVVFAFLSFSVLFVFLNFWVFFRFLFFSLASVPENRTDGPPWCLLPRTVCLKCAVRCWVTSDLVLTRSTLSTRWACWRRNTEKSTNNVRVDLFSYSCSCFPGSKSNGSITVFFFSKQFMHLLSLSLFCSFVLLLWSTRCFPCVLSVVGPQVCFALCDSASSRRRLSGFDFLSFLESCIVGKCIDPHNHTEYRACVACFRLLVVWQGGLSPAEWAAQHLSAISVSVSSSSAVSSSEQRIPISW